MGVAKASFSNYLSNWSLSVAVSIVEKMEAEKVGVVVNLVCLSNLRPV
jgi:hypothetical protein